MPIAVLDGPLPDAVAAFLDARLGARGAAHWRWKYREATPARPLGLCYVAPGGAVTGFIGLMRTALGGAGPVTRQVAWLVDWVAAEGTGLGAGLALLRQVEGMVPLPLTLGGSPVAREMYRLLGWTQRPIATVWTLAASGRALLERGPLRELRALGLPLRLAGALATPFVRVARPAPCGAALEPVERFPPAWDAVWSARRAELGPCMDRGSAELNWKFAEFPDDPAYRRFLLRDGEAIVGHLVLRADAHRGFARGRLVDCTWPAARPQWCAWLVGEAAWRLQRAGVDVVQCTASHPALGAALAAAGFRRTASLPLFHRRLPADVPAPEGWHVTYLDCDRAWR